MNLNYHSMAKEDVLIGHILLDLAAYPMMRDLSDKEKASYYDAIMSKYREEDYEQFLINDRVKYCFGFTCLDIDKCRKWHLQKTEKRSKDGEVAANKRWHPEDKPKTGQRRKRETKQEPGLFKEEAASDDDDVPLVEAEEVEPYPFVEFWNTFNFKRNKQTAEKAWKKLNNKDRAAAMAAIPNYHAYLEHKRSTGFNQNSLYPATYLKERRWEDDYSITDTTPQNNGNNRSYQSDYEHRKQQQNAVLTDFMAEAAARVQANEVAKNRGENI